MQNLEPNLSAPFREMDCVQLKLKLKVLEPSTKLFHLHCPYQTLTLYSMTIVVWKFMNSIRFQLKWLQPGLKGELGLFTTKASVLLNLNGVMQSSNFLSDINILCNLELGMEGICDYKFM